MRSDAKASSAGSNSGQSQLRPLITLCLALAGLLAFCASPALAAQTHPYTGTSFGPDGVGGTQSFEHVQAVAVDPASGDTYVYDQTAGKIYKFNSAGAPVSFSATGTNAISGVSGPGGGAEFEIALAPAGSPGGTAGDIYVATNTQAIQVFSSAGTELTAVEQGGETCGTATDPSGNLFAGIYSSTIKKFTPSANPPKAADEVLPAGVVDHGICNIAADGLGNLYAANYSGGGLFKLEGLADTTPTLVDSGANTMAVAPGSNDLFADRGNEVVQYDSAGNVLSIFAGGEIAASHGVAVNSGATKIYVATPAKVRVYGPFATVPDTTTEAISGLTKGAATLNGTINPAGLANVTCVFQYTTAASYFAEGFDGATEKPCSPAGPFSGNSNTAVSAAATGLSGETEYRYRLLSSSENGLYGGAVLSFATPGAVNVATAPVTNLAATGATLNGTINPEGVEIEECSFEYGTTESGSYGSTAPCVPAPAAVGTGNAPVAVHADLTGLVAGTEYHFRLTAKNEFGASTTPGAAFTTRAPTVQSLSLIGVGMTSAIFKAQIKPNGQETTYHFEYVTEAEYEASEFTNATQIPVGGEVIGAGTTGVEVEQEAVGLTPRTTYHLRVLATNVGGTAVSEELVFTTFSPTSSGLPDGRAYEQVTPVDKDGNSAQGGNPNQKSAPDGNGFVFVVDGGIPGGENFPGAANFLSLRTPSGWTSQGMFASARYGQKSVPLGLSEDFSTEYVTGAFQAVHGYLLEKDTATKQYSTLSEASYDAYAYHFAAGSADGEQALFETPAALEPGAPETEFSNLYLWDRPGGQFHLVSVFNNGAVPAEGAQSGPSNYSFTGGGGPGNYTQELNVLSADGSRVFFTDLQTGQLYMRVNPLQPQSAMIGEACAEAAKACTYEVSKSRRGTPDPEGPKPALFNIATASGSQVLFMSRSELTDDANTGPEDNSNDLYSYDTTTHNLVDLTASAPATNPHGAEVAGVLGTSEDGSYVYFAAGGILAAGATQGECQPGANLPGTCNIYLWHEGTISFVTQLKAPFGGQYRWLGENWNVGAARHSARVGVDGKTLVLYSANNLTGFDSHGFEEFYRYRVGDSKPLCLTCAPSGEAPKGPAKLETIGSGAVKPGSLNSTSVRAMSPDGNRFFFESPDRLLSPDTNGVMDVYEWEADGTGSCASDDQNGGCLYLISTGTSPQPSFFGDSSVNGDDIFFYTTQPLVGQDRDELVDIYDARVGGGLASQNPPPPSLCVGEACRSAASPPPASQSAGTSSFAGPSNPRTKQQQKKHRKKKKHEKKSKKHHEKSANSKRGNNR